MMNVSFDGSQEIGKPKQMTDEQCSSAHAMPFTQEIDMPDGTKAPVQCFLLCYQPSLEDLNALNAGQQVWLKIMAPGLPPHFLWTMNSKGEANV